MKEAIQKAYSGGYSPKKLNSKFEWSEDGNSATQEYQVDWRDCVLDHLFWQALGKSLGWTGLYERDTPEERKMTYGDLMSRHWKTHWHSFIDHLAEGKDAESFFQKILNQTK